MRATLPIPASVAAPDAGDACQAVADIFSLNQFVNTLAQLRFVERKFHARGGGIALQSRGMKLPQNRRALANRERREDAPTEQGARRSGVNLRPKSELAIEPDHAGQCKIKLTSPMKARAQILITGGTGTLGNAIVVALRALNYGVVANYWNDEKRAQALADFTGCTLARADVRDENAVRLLCDSHRFDAVIHAAGASRDALLLRTSDELWREQMRWLDAAFLVTRAALRVLPRGGSLMLIASRVGERGSVGQSAYAASKGAMLGLTQGAAAERADLKINAICPGFAPSALSGNMSEARVKRRLDENLLPDADAAYSVAQMCLCLLNSNLSGQIVRPDCRV